MRVTDSVLQRLGWAIMVIGRSARDRIGSDWGARERCALMWGWDVVAHWDACVMAC
jgi:hypothetical protein